MPPGTRKLSGIFGEMLDGVLRKVNPGRSGVPTPRPNAPTPRPNAPTPRPNAPTPRPNAPTPRPEAPTPRPGAGTPPGGRPGGGTPGAGTPAGGGPGGGTPGGAGSGPGGSAPGGGGRTPLHTEPTAPAGRNDYPYLNDSPGAVRETGAVDGPVPDYPEPYVRAGDPPPPAGMMETFQGEVRYEPVQPGETIYRDLGAGQRPAGGYWGSTPTGSEQVLRSDLAVRNDWNGAGGQVAYTPSSEVPAWRGEAAPQPGAGSTPSGPGSYHLPGGGEQIGIRVGRDGNDFPPADMRPDANGVYPPWQIGPNGW